MANPKLVSLFKGAKTPLSFEEAETTLCAARDRYGPVKTYFGLPVYRNPVGIEVEVEGYGGLPIAPFYWSVTEDNSLKKMGAELVSRPLRGQNIDYALHELYLIAQQNDFTFSHRTSVHVHCNVSTFTYNQLKSLLAVYACMEELYFSYAKEARQGNTFCYRLVGTPPEIVFYSSSKEGEMCTKYCALNIQPVSTQMTVEFRHLDGTTDRRRLRRWIQLCAKLVGWVETLPEDECVGIIFDALCSDRMTETIQSILGDTGSKLFSKQAIDGSVNNGAIWAAGILTSEDL